MDTIAAPMAPSLLQLAFFTFAFQCLVLEIWLMSCKTGRENDPKIDIHSHFHYVISEGTTQPMAAIHI